MSVETPVETDMPGRLRAGLFGVFVVDDTSTQLAGRQELVRFRGRFQVPSEEAYERVSAYFARLGYTPLFRREEGRDVVIAVPGTVDVRPGRPWLNVLLFALTVISVILMGAEFAINYYELVPPTAGEGDLLAVAGLILQHWTTGLPYAAALLAILGCHEFGHYLVARRHGVAVSLPYFIPMPLPPLGTMGAAIVQKEPFRNRKVLFDVGVAGPLAGLVVTIPVLLLGLSLSKIEPITSPSMMEGNSLLYLALKYLVFGRILPSGGVDVYIHPIAFAGWAGLLVTSLNLLPAGQLDGGHIAYVLFGERTRQISTAVMLVAAALGAAPYVLGYFGVQVASWDGWLLWALLIYFFARQHPPAMDEVTELDPGRRVLAWLMIVVFVLVFIPVPLQLV